mmetsp:Transcript_9683/g.13587  ORF Transcript_9683/g.13587 Transcript_9683/m.13587 type:complete len:134 (+) Transcript_9683:95-496(+)
MQPIACLLTRWHMQPWHLRLEGISCIFTRLLRRRRLVSVAASKDSSESSLWDLTEAEEFERIREYWLGLSHAQRHNLVRLDKVYTLSATLIRVNRVSDLTAGLLVEEAGATVQARVHLQGLSEEKDTGTQGVL